MGYWVLVALGAMFVAYKCSWKQIAEILGLLYVCSLAVIIAVQHSHIVDLEQKLQISAQATIEQEQALKRLTIKVYEFLDAIKKEQEWHDVAPNVTLPEYIDDSIATESGAITASAPLVELGK